MDFVAYEGRPTTVCHRPQAVRLLASACLAMGFATLMGSEAFAAALPDIRGIKVSGKWTFEIPEQQSPAGRVQGPVEFENYYLNEGIVMRFVSSGGEEVILYRPDRTTRYAGRGNRKGYPVVNAGPEMHRWLGQDAAGATPFLALWTSQHKASHATTTQLGRSGAAISEFDESNLYNGGRTSLHYQIRFEEGKWVAADATQTNKDGKRVPFLVTSFSDYTDPNFPGLPKKLRSSCVHPPSMPPEHFDNTVTSFERIDAA